MKAKSEREFHLVNDKGLKVTAFFKKNRILDKIVLLFFDTLCRIFNFIFSGVKQSRRNIGILSLHRLGDTVFTIPAIREIISYYKEYNVYIFCYPESKAIYEILFHPEMLKVISNREFILGRRLAKVSAKKTIKSIDPEIIYDLTGTTASASLLWNLKASEKIGMNIRYLKNLYTVFTPIREKPHFMDIYLDIVKSRIPISNNPDLYRFDYKRNFKDKILLHPFAIRLAKEWKFNRFLSLAKDLISEYNLELVVPPGFIDEDVTDEIHALNIPLNITNTIEDLIEKIEECSVFISNDSGPTYIANLLGKATFTIYGPTNPKYSLPVGLNHDFIQMTIPCTPIEDRFCFTHGGIYCPSNDCMNLLALQEVTISLRKFLDRLKVKRKNDIVNNPL